MHAQKTIHGLYNSIEFKFIWFSIATNILRWRKRNWNRFLSRNSSQCQAIAFFALFDFDDHAIINYDRWLKSTDEPRWICSEKRLSLYSINWKFQLYFPFSLLFQSICMRSIVHFWVNNYEVIEEKIVQKMCFLCTNSVFKK